MSELPDSLPEGWTQRGAGLAAIYAGGRYIIRRCGPNWELRTSTDTHVGFFPTRKEAFAAALVIIAKQRFKK